MKLHSYLSTGLAVGGFLLAGTMAYAQNVPETKDVHPAKTTSGQSSVQAGIAVDHAGGNGVRRAVGGPRKHLGNVKYSDRTSTGTNTHAPGR